MPPRFSDLLLQVLHRDSALPDPERLAAFTPADWHAFTAEAIQFRLAFQVLECLTGNPRRAALVPTACIENLRAAVRGTLMRNLRQQGHLRKILAACQTENIPVILLKGLWLSETVYRDIKARETGDIDLLLRPEDMPSFTALVRQLGFNVPAGIQNLVDLSPTCNEFPLTHPGDGAFFDIHWTLTHPVKEASIDQASLWKRSQVVTIAGVPCRSLCLEDHLLYICFHAAEHHRFVYVGPRALLDVALLVSQPPQQINWDDVVARARELAWSRSAWLMFVLTQNHLGIAPPGETVQALRPQSADDAHIRGAAIEALFRDQRYQERMADNVVRLIDEPSWLKRASLVANRLFPPREEIEKYFKTRAEPPGLYWLYVRRCGILLKDHMPDLFQIIRGEPVRTAELNRTEILSRWMDS